MFISKRKHERIVAALKAEIAAKDADIQKGIAALINADGVVNAAHRKFTEMAEAERELSAAYVRLRSILGALVLPDSANYDHYQIWDAVEKIAVAVVAERDALRDTAHMSKVIQQHLKPGGMLARDASPADAEKRRASNRDRMRAARRKLKQGNK